MCEEAQGWHWRRLNQLASVPRVNAGEIDCHDRVSLGGVTKCQSSSERLWRMGLLALAPVAQESVVCS